MVSESVPILSQLFFRCALLYIGHISASSLISSVNVNGRSCCTICLPPPPPPVYPPLTLKRIFMMPNEEQLQEMLLYLPSTPDSPPFGCENPYSPVFPTVNKTLEDIGGPKGEKGKRGPRGSKGFPGPQGTPGIPGPPGAFGPLGQTGEKGDRGWVGISGEKGQAGIVKGQQGRKGSKGDKGLIGHRGPDGEKGSAGYYGPIGWKGDIGSRGTTGLDGAVGPRGIPGKRGFMGIKGDLGAPGTLGPAGPMGHRGSTGPPGPPGRVHLVPGPKGDKGVNGTTEKCDCAQQNMYQPEKEPEFNEIPFIFIVNNEEEMSQLKFENIFILRRDTRMLYVFNGSEFSPIKSAVTHPQKYCSDGVRNSEHGEDCDDGNQEKSDSCINCLDAFCGDGHRHVGVEECDQQDLGKLTCASYLPGSYGELKCDRHCNIDSTDCRFFRD